MTDQTRSAHLALLVRARIALASYAETSGDIADIITDLDAAAARIDRTPVPWSIPVHLANISHGHGTTVATALSHKGLLEQVATFCRAQWGEINDDRDPGDLDDATVVGDYFNRHPEDQLITRIELIDPDLGYDTDRLEIGNYLALSSSHVSWPTTVRIDEWLMLDPSDRPVSVADTHHGWLLRTVPASFGDQSEIPDDLFNALTVARNHGCNYLILDRDAPASDRLPCFD
ncbi:hypothetical protein [Sphingobium aquiterrae]|uniref:DUF5983 family protein n=1 Tax=Sphingobium aquiterrae TaxID=2038656 RepID=UPI0030167292|tara:strand:+ start:7731 stop:8423 length:693 start_codon:yes stop_codon:yes gene_type:complete